MKLFKEILESTKETTINLKKDFDLNSQIRKTEKEIRENLENISMQKKMIGDLVCSSIALTKDQILELNEQELELAIKTANVNVSEKELRLTILSVFQGEKLDDKLRDELKFLQKTLEERKDYTREKTENVIIKDEISEKEPGMESSMTEIVKEAFDDYKEGKITSEELREILDMK